VLIDGDRLAGALPAGRRAFYAFSIERWVDGGCDSWWVVFWIYNLAYSAASLVLLAPALLILVVMLVMRGSVGAIVGGCVGLLLMLFLGGILLMLTGIWVQKAIVVCVARRVDAGEALRRAWAETRRDAARHFTVAFVVLVITIGGIGVISMLSLLVSVPTAAAPTLTLVFMPVRVLASMLQSAYGAAAGNLSLAAFASISEP
jgi:hypothetical protein